MGQGMGPWRPSPVSTGRSPQTCRPNSAGSFPDAETLAAAMEAAGFTRVRFRRMTFGIVALDTGLSG